VQAGAGSRLLCAEEQACPYAPHTWRELANPDPPVPTARAAWESGRGRATTTARIPTSFWPAPGTSPTLETLAAAAILRDRLPELKVRFVNVMLNDMDRYHLVMDVIDRVPGLGQRAAGLRQEMVDERLHKRAYTREHGDDPEDIRDWVWPF
jgi:hypothetical protein